MNIEQLNTRFEEICGDKELTLYSKLDLLRQLSNGYVDLPTKPMLKSLTPTDVDMLQYAQDLIQYDIDLPIATQASRERNEFNRDVQSEMKCIICDESGLNDIPEQYRDKVYSKAWQDGHSGGYIEVYNELLDLVALFK